MPSVKYSETKLDFGGRSDDPKPGEMQVVYEGDVPVMVDFLCPCGCGAECPTFLVGPKRPRTNQRNLWDFSHGPNGGVTLSPSIRFTGGCKAHFNITDGEAVMHGDSGK